jgi:hypothetical protein
MQIEGRLDSCVASACSCARVVSLAHGPCMHMDRGCAVYITLRGRPVGTTGRWARQPYSRSDVCCNIEGQPLVQARGLSIFRTAPIDRLACDVSRRMNAMEPWRALMPAPARLQHVPSFRSAPSEFRDKPPQENFVRLSR